MALNRILVVDEEILIGTDTAASVPLV